jgi:hypothetical protein
MVCTSWAPGFPWDLLSIVTRQDSALPLKANFVINALLMQVLSILASPALLVASASKWSHICGFDQSRAFSFVTVPAFTDML